MAFRLFPIVVNWCTSDVNGSIERCGNRHTIRKTKREKTGTFKADFGFGLSFMLFVRAVYHVVSDKMHCIVALHFAGEAKICILFQA